MVLGLTDTPSRLITCPSVKNGFGVINVTLHTKSKDNGNAVKKVLSSVQSNTLISFLSVYATF